MSYFDKNRIFFGLFHYILSEQSNVNWALKTSLVNFTGLNETINQRQYKNDSISNDIIKYVKDIKPYHVQFDNYIEKYSSKDDICNIIPSDSIFPTIKVRYDAVSTKPDIKDTIYTYTETDEPSSLKATNDTIKYLNIELKSVYVLKYDRHNKPFWEFYSTANDGDLFYVEKDDSIKRFSYIVNKDGFGYYDMVELTNKELVEFENTTAANRLFLYKTHDFDLIKDYLNAHFKGLTLDGGEFNIDRFGYDAFLYDLKRYEEPVKTIGYCFVNKNYSQISVGTTTFKIDSDSIIEKNYLTIVSSIKSEITDYYLNNNEITLFSGVLKDEIITITYTPSSGPQKIYRYISNTFTESTDENYVREFIDVNSYSSDNEYILNIPYSSVKINKLVVELEKPSGYRFPTTDYTIKDDTIHLPITFEPNNSKRINWKVYISIADYSLIYDKIYTWEDVYGIANNKIAWENYWKNNGLIQNNHGGNFLNPYYESDRPSELTAIYPQNSLILYSSRANAVNDDYTGNISFAAKKIYYSDFKNKQLNFNVIKTAKLVNDFSLGDIEFTANKDIFEKPYISKEDRHTLIPGKLFIGGEMIEYFDYIINDNNTVTFKKIRRGCNGTFINDKTYKAGTFVYPQYNEKDMNYNVTPSYYYIKTNDIRKLTINGNAVIKDLIKVYKTTNVTLLSDITPKSNSFIISDNSINLPIYKKEYSDDPKGMIITNELLKNGFFYIGDDKIEFKKIEKADKGYKISDFKLPLDKTYKAGTQISSILYEEVNPSNYIINEEQYDELRHLDGEKMRAYVEFPNPLNPGECYIIENHNKNVFN